MRSPEAAGIGFQRELQTCQAWAFQVSTENSPREHVKARSVGKLAKAFGDDRSKGAAETALDFAQRGSYNGALHRDEVGQVLTSRVLMEPRA